jgi:hypothetical protein
MTVDFAMAASQNIFCAFPSLEIQYCLENDKKNQIFLLLSSFFKKAVVKQYHCMTHVLCYICILYRFVMQPLQNPPICSSTYCV